MESININANVDGTTTAVESKSLILTKTNNFRWLKRGWFNAVLQQASVTQYGDVWWDDVPTTSSREEE